MNEATAQVFDLSGQVAIVTGGGNGIGASIARRLAGAGASVVVTDIDEEAATRTVEAIKADGGTAAAFRADATSLDDSDAVVQKAQSQFGGWTRWSTTPACTATSHSSTSPRRSGTR